MTGMETVIDLRRCGLKPAAVFVDLVAEAHCDPYALSASGIVSVNIGRGESLSAIDFRPLVGLTVHVYDNTGDLARQRKVSAMVAAVQPALLVVPVVDEDTWIVHRRIAGNPPITDRIRL